MADVEKKMQVKFDAQDNTKGAFASLGQNVQKLQGSTNSLNSALT